MRAQIIQDFVVERDPSMGSLDEIDGHVRLKLNIVNHRFTRIGLGGYKDVASETLRPIAYIRKRTLYDNEHTSPLTDFDLTDFEVDQELPDLDRVIDRINQHWTRVVPKRGIEVAIDGKTEQNGLTELVIRRMDSDRLVVSVTIHGHTRQFQIKGNKFFDKRGQPLAPKATPQSHAFASYCMSAIAEWMYRPKVETSEGTVEEGKPGPIKGGYFAYLRIRDSDGYRYRRGDEQWLLCAAERGVDLDKESERLKPQDETGKMRNSTYYREHPDDGAHLPPLKVYL